MKAVIYNSLARGEITPPPSKSYLHRAIICASLAKGTSEISNYQESEDILATINCLIPFGVKFSVDGNNLVVVSNGLNHLDEVQLDAKASGSTLRFLIPIVSFYANKVTFKGEVSLLKRPLDTYINLFKDKMQVCDSCVLINGALDQTEFFIDDLSSSQFITGLLFYLAITNKDIRIYNLAENVSLSYIDLTIDVLNEFGFHVDKYANVYTVMNRENNRLRSANVLIEADYSAASNFLVLSKINSHISVNGLNKTSLQGDKIILDYLEDSCEFDLANAIDLGPIMFAYAAALPTKTKFVGTNRLVYKESNRIEAMKEELEKFGVSLEVYDNIVFVTGKAVLECKIELNPHNDHRVAMALAILSTIARGKTTINNIECVNKSYPNFFKDLENCGIKIEYLE